MKRLLQNRGLCIAGAVSVLAHALILSFGLSGSAFDRTGGPAVELRLSGPRQVRTMKATLLPGGGTGDGSGTGTGSGSGQGAGTGTGSGTEPGTSSGAGSAKAGAAAPAASAGSGFTADTKVADTKAGKAAAVSGSSAAAPAKKAAEPVKTEKIPASSSKTQKTARTAPPSENIISSPKGGSPVKVPEQKEQARASQEDEGSVIFKKNRKGGSGAAQAGGKGGEASAGSGGGSGKGGSGGAGDSGRPVITANTRDVGYAMYYKALRKKIENQGLINFPMKNGERLYGELTVRIPVYYDGTLYEKEGGPSIERTSGNRALDQASLMIVRRAAPFGPFPKSMRPASGGADVWIIITRLKFTREDGGEQVHSTAR